MLLAKRCKKNPILVPDPNLPWEAEGAFNGCPAIDGDTLHLLYRASSKKTEHEGQKLNLSSIALADSRDGVNFINKRPFIVPKEPWEKFGCEDPRVTKINGKYYIFYTALSQYPFRAEGIKIGLAVTRDFKTVDKHPVTFFNAKAMALFPEKVGGKFTAILTLHTDSPPAEICIVQFEKEQQMWSRDFWEEWYSRYYEGILSLRRSPYDHTEVGAPPIKTKHGWLLIYSYIRNYFNPPVKFGIEAALLDLNDPTRVISRTPGPVLVPEEEYEKTGEVANIVFPSGAILENDNLFLYYGGADTNCCLAVLPLQGLLDSMLPVEKLQRYEGNPIIYPDPAVPWKRKAVFNPGVFYDGKAAHIFFRAMSEDNTSVIGYARSKNGYDIDEELLEPVYTPRIEAEQKFVANGNSGCEDPRITVIDGTVYMCYTVYNGRDMPAVALTSLPLADCLARKWNWSLPQIISPAQEDDKDAALFPRKINGQYVFLHRINKEIYIDHVPDLDFSKRKIDGVSLMLARPGHWDDEKVGITGPPIETSQGWLLMYHGISKRDMHYRLGAALLDLEDPRIVLARLPEPIFKPAYPYEKEGQVSNVVFPCGAYVKDDTLFVYYGGADRVIGVATLKFQRLIDWLVKFKQWV